MSYDFWIVIGVFKIIFMEMMADKIFRLSKNKKTNKSTFFINYCQTAICIIYKTHLILISLSKSYEKNIQGVQTET